MINRLCAALTLFLAACAVTPPPQSSTALALTFKGVHYAPLQNLRPDFTDNPLPVEGWLKYADGHVVFEQELTRAGVYTGWHRYIAKGDETFDVNVRSNQFRPASSRTIRRRASLMLPHLLLMGTPDPDLVIDVDPSTGLVRRVELPATLPLVGRKTWQYEYDGYRSHNGVMVPGRRITRLSGQITERIDYRYDSRPVTASDFELPKGATLVDAGAERAQKQQTVRDIGGNVYVLANIAGTDSTVLAVSFNDFVAVVGAPQGASDAVMAAIAALGITKPIRYVIPTHHHSDHAAGVTSYRARGTTILTTPGNEAMLRTVVPDATIEIVRRRHVIKDSSAHLELYDIGPTPHADEMLIAWLPSQRALYQSDLLEIDDEDAVDESTANEVTETFLDRLRALQLPVETIIGAEGRVASMADLERAVALRRGRR